MDQHRPFSASSSLLSRTSLLSLYSEVLVGMGAEGEVSTWICAGVEAQGRGVAA